jgi:hypothetical protein
MNALVRGESYGSVIDEINRPPIIWSEFDASALEPKPFLSDLVFWDKDGKAKLHLVVEFDEIALFALEEYPESIHCRSLDPFYGMVAQVRY